MENSSFGRLIGVLVAPAKTFRSIAERPTWGVAMVVFVLCLAATSILLFQKADFGELMREQMATRGQEVPPNAEGMEGFMKGCAIIGAIGVPLILVMGVAAIYLVFNLMGGQLNYKTSLSVVLHAAMPAALSSLLSIPILLARESLTMQEVQSGRVLQSNLSFLAPEDAGPRLITLLSALDFFSIWSLILSILGLHIAARVSKAKAASIVILLWVVVVLLLVGLAGLRGGPSGG